MSVQPLTPPDPPPLLAVVSSIMDFPAPGIASATMRCDMRLGTGLPCHVPGL